MELILGLCAFIICIEFASIAAGKTGFDYRISVPDENVLKPCESHPNNNVEKIFDISNITYSYDDNEKVLVSGTSKYIGNVVFANDAILSGEVQVFKKQRGVWTSTPYNFYRPDLCGSIWNPSELWYSLTNSVPEKQRICPPKPGSVYEFDFDVEMLIKNCPDRNADGDYMAQITLKHGSLPDEFICLTVLGYIEKI